MKPLGTISLRHEATIQEARRKVRQVVELLTGSRMLAVRIATATSQICRHIVTHTSKGNLTVEFGTHRDQQAFALHFEAPLGLPSSSEFQPFFNVIQQTAGPGVRALKVLADTEDPSQALVDQVKQILDRKERDELMAELQVRNQELNRSLDDLRRTTSAKQRMESELNIGRDIQMSMLPLVFPPFPDRREFSILATLVPAREVGGDFYDFFFVDRERLCVCVGDVSGKGVPAALFMAVTKTLIKSVSKTDVSPASIITQVNDELSQNNEACMFVTLLFGILDVTTGEFTYCNAGHNPPFVKRANGQLEKLPARHGPVVGAMDGTAYREDRTQLKANDLLVVYTDGVTEATSVAQELFSEERLAVLLAEATIRSPTDAVERIQSAVQTFETGAEQFDDVTILAVQYFGMPSQAKPPRLTLNIGNDFAAIDRATETFTEFAEEHKVPEGTRRRLNVALDELLNNAISYGDARGNDEVALTLDLTGPSLVITLEDEGTPFNPFEREAPETGQPLADREIGGLGIHIVKNLMDEVHYERRGEKNVITLTKHLADHEPDN
jgi:sigma-B regulation protein RsbU (phosphoserine phosphatase)